MDWTYSASSLLSIRPLHRVDGCCDKRHWIDSCFVIPGVYDVAEHWDVQEYVS